MPIAFVRTHFLNLTRRGGACKTVAYLGRTAVLDERLGTTFDYAGIARDLVYERLILPGNAPFRTAAELANALDEAERRRQRSSTNRKRLPQFGAHLIFALPPDPILTLDETTEVVDRFVTVAIGGSAALPGYVAIHDPASATPGAVNRHAHILIGLREVDGTGLSRRKVRHLFAHPRHAAAGNVRTSYVAEALHWPDIARNLQHMMFAEVGSSALVDPPAPFGGRHWSAKALRRSPGRRARHDETTYRQNVELINGDPAMLVARMLRGRSAMRVDEVRSLIARFLDSEEDRQWRLDTILSDTKVVPLAQEPTETKPQWLTTKAMYDAIGEALALVDRAAASRSAGAPSRSPVLEVIVASGEAAIVTTLAERLSGSSRRVHRPLVIGQKHSDCRDLATEIKDCQPTVGTVKALEAVPRRNNRGRSDRVGLRRGGFIVVPRAEGLSDQDLATLLLRAEKYSARLLLGYDVSRMSPSSSLAARLADKLGDGPVVDVKDAAYYLKAGLVDQACRALYRDERVRFHAPDREAREAFDFVVSDDEERLAGLDREIRSARPGGGEIAVTDRLSLVHGQWIVYTASDYNTQQIRAGRFARVVGTRSPHAIEVIDIDGAKATLDATSFPRVRSAYAITVREGRRAPRDAKLLIEATTRQHAWSAALLAASRAQKAIIQVDPAVAKNLTEWIAVVSRSKPAPLPTDLTLRDDPSAEINVLMRRIYSGTPKEKQEPETFLNRMRFDEWVEAMPEPRQPKEARLKVDYAPAASAPEDSPSKAEVNLPALAPQPSGSFSDAQRRQLAEEIRAAIFQSADTRLALHRLQTALAPTNDQRQINADNLARVCPANGPMAALIAVLLGRPEQTEPDELADLELPADMTVSTERCWGIWEMWQFKCDLRTMATPGSNWPIPRVSSEPAKAAALRFPG